MAAPPPTGPRPLPRVQDNGWVVGQLLAHGPAKYRNEPDRALSYFVRIRTTENELGAHRRVAAAEREARPIDGRVERLGWSPDDGGIRTVWGTDLKRAIEESKSHVKVGQVVALRLVARERIFFGRHSTVSAVDQKNAYRNRYEVETPQFIARRQQFARAVNENVQSARRGGIDHPESLALYLIHDGARRLAEERYPNRDDQQQFLARVRHFFEAGADRESLIAKTVERLNLQKAARNVQTPPIVRDPMTRE